VEERSQTAYTSFVGTSMSTMTTIKLDWSCIMHEHIIETVNITTKFDTLGMIVNDNFHV